MRKRLLLPFFLPILLLSCAQKTERVKILFVSPVKVTLKGKLAIFTSNQWSDFSKELLDFLLREIKSLRPNVELIPVTDSSWEDFGYSQDLHVMNALMEAKKKGFDFALLIWIKQVKGKTQDKLESISVEIRLLEIKRRIDCIAAIVTINNRENLSRRVILHRIAKIIASRLI